MPFKVVEKYEFIYYTYAAKTSQTNGVQNEHLWNVKSRKWNGCRCLEIPHSEKKPGGLCIRLVILCGALKDASCDVN